MQMSVSPKEIAEHLVDELGLNQALETYKYHVNRCKDDETAGIWHTIGEAISNLKSMKKH